MKSVRLFDYLQYDGQAWQVVSQDGPELALKDLASDRIRWPTPAAAPSHGAGGNWPARQ